jgi:hypothetical protein
MNIERSRCNTYTSHFFINNMNCYYLIDTVFNCVVYQQSFFCMFKYTRKLCFITKIFIVDVHQHVINHSARLFNVVCVKNVKQQRTHKELNYPCNEHCLFASIHFLALFFISYGYYKQKIALSISYSLHSGLK